MLTLATTPELVDGVQRGTALFIVTALILLVLFIVVLLLVLLRRRGPWKSRPDETAPLPDAWEEAGRRTEPFDAEDRK